MQSFIEINLKLYQWSQFPHFFFSLQLRQLMLLYVTVLTSHYFKLSISISLLNFDFLKVAKTLITDFVVNRFARNFANFYLKLLQTHLSRESFNFCRKKKFNFSFYNSAKAKLFFFNFHNQIAYLAPTKLKCTFFKFRIF